MPWDFTMDIYADPQETNAGALETILFVRTTTVQIMGKFSKIHRKRSPFHQDPYATSPLTPSEKDALSGKKGGIHSTMWKAAKSGVGAIKDIFTKK